MQIRIQSGADIPCGRNLFESKQQENFFQVSLNIKVRQSCPGAYHSAIFGRGWGADVSLHLFLTSELDKGEQSASRTARFIPTGIMKGGGPHKISANLEKKKNVAPAWCGTTIP